MLIMGLALVMTASRAGFITLLISGAVSLWHFGVRGRRFALIIATLFAGVLLLAVAGGPLLSRMSALTGEADSRQEQKAYESYEQRRYLMIKALEAIERYPVFGVGALNFEQYSGVWHEVHMSYLEIAVEGGIPCGILYLLFFYRGFKNLKKLRKLKNLDVHTTLFVGGLHASLVGFVVGALFAPEAYQFFPYFAVAYTSALVATVKEQGTDPMLSRTKSLRAGKSFTEVYARNRNSDALTSVR
jgi:O-antigen ligase